MNKLWNRLTAMAIAVGLMTAAAAPAVASQGELTVKDSAKLFTADGIKAAKEAFGKNKYDSPTKITVITYDGLPSRRKAEYDKLKDRSEQDRFIDDWTRDEAKAEGVKGIFVLVATNPNKIRVVASEQMRANREFGEKKCERMTELLVTAFRESRTLSGDVQKQGHDVGLLKVAEYAGEQLIGTKAVDKPKSSGTQDINQTGAKLMNGGGGMLGWICLIGVVLLGAWLVIGLIRGLTGMMGGGGGMMGGGYGGGGGGFMSSLLGGMFGSMAGMWMYNNLFGGGMSSMSAGDYGGGGYGGDTGGTAVGDDGNFDNGATGGAGDWGDSGGGGDYGGGDFGGGDFGGGDFGGGGDMGGGGDW